MNKINFYEQLVRLTRKIYKKNIAERLFFAVEKHDEDEFNFVFKELMTGDAELFKQIEKFKKICHDEYKEKRSRLILFGKEENLRKNLKLFNPNIIDAPSFLVLSFCIKMDDATFFDIENDIKALTTYVNAINASGYRELSSFLYSESWISIYRRKKYNTLYALLEAVFNGEFE